MEEKKFWKDLFNSYLIFYLIAVVVSFFMSYIGLQQLDVFNNLFFAINSRVTNYASEAYWLGMLCYFLAPFWIIVFTKKYLMIKVYDNSYRCKVCTYILMYICSLISVFYLYFGLSSGSGRLHSIFMSNILGMYVIYFCMWVFIQFTIIWSVSKIILWSKCNYGK